MADREELLIRLREELREASVTDDAGVRNIIDELIGRERAKTYIALGERERLKNELFAAVRGFDILQPFLDDPSVTEIMVNGPERIFIERNGVITRRPETFRSAEKLENMIHQIVGSCDRVINERQPIADARLSDGSRVNAVIAPVALDGPILTIRRFPEEALTMTKLIAMGAISEEAAADLECYAAAGYSMLISGGTSAGKTTFLNALAQYIPKDERIITIEDNAELQIRGIPNLVRLEAKAANMEGNREITIRDLIRTALRMRPDRIIVGEVRGEEAAELMQALNTGHQGSLSTIHANSAADSLSRLETLILMGMTIPLRAIRAQIRSGIDLVVHLARLPDKSRRVIEIAEIVKDGRELIEKGGRLIMTNDGEVYLRTLYEWDHTKQRLVFRNPLSHTDKLVRAGRIGGERHDGI